MLKSIWVSVAVAACVAGCGGGGDSGGVAGSVGAVNPATPVASGAAEGFWQGTTNNGRTVRAVVLDDGTYWAMYSAVNSPGVVSGVVQGVGRSSAGSFSSASGRDFNVEAGSISDATVSASYREKQSFSGSFAYPSNNATVTFTSTYGAAYDRPAALSALTGTYAGTAATSAGTEATTFSISSAGTIAGTSVEGCQFTGTAAIRKNVGVFDLSVTFRGGVCVQGTSTISGIAYLDGVGLYAAALNATRTDGTILVATKTGTGTGTVAPPVVTVPVTGAGSGTTVGTGGSSGCGARGGPGYRKANGQCASWADYYASRR